MEEFSILNLIFLSTPEYFLSLMFSLIVVGERSKIPLKSDRETLKNFLKMLGVSLTISTLECIADTYISNMIMKAILTMTFYVLAIKIFYSLSWKKAVIGTLAFSFLIISIEAIYAPACLKMFFHGSQKDLFASNLRIFYSMPIRFMQATAILSAWNLHLAITKLKQYNLSVLTLVIAAFMLFFFELVVLNTYMTYFEVFSLSIKISLGSFCACFGLVNFYIPLKCATIITKISKYSAKGGEI